MPLPNAEPIGLPAPAWLLQTLLVLTFTLHMVPMLLTVGGSALALVAEVMSRTGKGANWQRLARRWWAMLPTITSFTVTLGVAPLLFIQLVYGKFFYPASLLTGWFWFAVVPVLLLGYGMLYLQSMGAPEARWRPWAGLVAVLSFLAVGAIYVSTMSLTTAPQVWKEMYAATQAGTHWYFSLPRGLHVLCGALAMAGGLTVVLGHLAADDEAYSRFCRRLGLGWLTGAVLLEVPAALWFRAALSADAKAALVPWLVAAAVGVGLVGYVAFWLAEGKGRKLLVAWAGMAALAVAGIFLAVQRHLVRQALMAPHITAADWKLQPQWDVFAIFAVLLVGTIGVIGWLVVRFMKEVAVADKKGSRAA